MVKPRRSGEPVPVFPRRVIPVAESGRWQPNGSAPFLALGSTIRCVHRHEWTLPCADKRRVTNCSAPKGGQSLARQEPKQTLSACDANGSTDLGQLPPMNANVGCR